MRRISLEEWVEERNMREEKALYTRKNSYGKTISEVWKNDIPENTNYGKWYMSFEKVSPSGEEVPNKELGMFLCDINAIELGYIINDPIFLSNQINVSEGIKK